MACFTKFSDMNAQSLRMAVIQGPNV